MNINRQIIYLLVTVCIIVPFIFPINFPQNIMPQTRKLFDFIDAIEPRSKVVLISSDYAPGTMPENHPMMLAVLRHCLAKHVRVVVVSLEPQNPSLALDAIDEVTAGNE